ncbi:sensor histidine kinase [Tahibacter soli]|uniref:histidine kinase n=1 Tax=Tahibacter soli TaxID=2983605 RepID=A0A9X3YNL5_9GAMM|nr:HAMP domain-containing sensor histidine kinase [Tahibacter soli]MDC8014530.1 HAMP domain-containing sensor histidine kinase [Tahibacter soli]
MTGRAADTGFTRTRLRAVVAALFFALAVPVVVLVAQAQRQMRFEAFDTYRRMADELARRIDASLARAIDEEQSRGYDDYGYALGGLTSNATRLSPLARFPAASALPGVAGYYQIDADGRFSTPWLPAGDAAAWGLAADDVRDRVAARDGLVDVLARHGLVDVARTPLAQAAFDQLNTPAQQQALSNKLGRVDELPLAQNFPAPATPQAAVKRAARPASTTGGLFDSEVDPFEFALLDDDYGVLYRKAWRDGRRTIQGALVRRAAFVDAAFAAPFLDTALAQAGDMAVAWHGDVIRVVGASGASDAATLTGELLLQTRLSAPFDGFGLVWNVRELPAGPGARVVAVASASTLAVLVVACLLLYRAGLRQIALVRQQRDFVAAVSHELKTPLTSVRMYAEILREGWASDEKKREYYDFICDESERLSRLVANVLALARLERSEFALERKPHRAETLIDLVRSKVQRQIDEAGFAVRYDVDPACAARTVNVDADAFVQMSINLVDNALKFARHAARREIAIGVAPHGAASLRFFVRDYGPGVAPSQRRRIFELFARGDDAQALPGTGIGLALVQRLARAMDGEVDVIAREPGAEFGVTLPAADVSSGA